MADLPCEPGESIADACPSRPAVTRMTAGFATSLAKKVTPCCSVTSVCRAPLPPAGFAAASARSSPPRSLPWTSSSSRIKFLLAIIRLAFLLVRLSGFRLDARHVPDGDTKRSILNASAHATKVIPLAVALRVLRLSAARYHDWRPPVRLRHPWEVAPTRFPSDGDRTKISGPGSLRCYLIMTSQ